MMSTVCVSDKALEASYYIAKLIAREKKPHTIGEKLIKTSMYGNCASYAWT